MTNRLPLTDHDGEVRELTEEDFGKTTPFSSLPESLCNKLSELKTRGPWRLSKTPALAFALPLRLFINLGLPSIAPR